MRSMIFLVLVIVISGCASSGKMQNVHIGMTEEDLIKVLGEPVSVSNQGEKSLLNYNFSETYYDALRGRTDHYHVKIINGRVKSYGRTDDFIVIEKPTVTIQQKVEPVLETIAKIEEKEECIKEPIVEIQKSEKVKTEVKSEPELYTELKKLKKMRDNGALSEKEYQKRKKEILVTQLGRNFINFSQFP